MTSNEYAIAAREMMVSTRPVVQIKRETGGYAIVQWLDCQTGTESCRVKWVQGASIAENIGMMVWRFIAENRWDYTPDIAYRAGANRWIVTLR